MFYSGRNGSVIAARWTLLTILIGLLTLNPVSAIACATCGCSEICPIAMMEDSESGKNKSSLSDSIWGNIILKMAYQRDPELQKLRKHIRGVNDITAGTVGTAVGGTLAQNVISMACLNPAPGISDSYLPGGLGLGLSGLVNIVFDGNIVVSWRLKNKIKARQIAIRNNVETILNHLEYSETNCPEAQTELAGIIGPRAASDCIQLWRSSHATASAMKSKTISQASSDGSISNETMRSSLGVVGNAEIHVSANP
jgi:hypothetical protein